MDGEELIQVHFQIPSGALDSLSRLAEQLRLLTEAAHGWAVSPGGTAEAGPAMENDSFDLARFQALWERVDTPVSAGTALSDLEDARAVFTEISPAGEAKTVSGTAAAALGEAASASPRGMRQIPGPEAPSPRVPSEPPAGPGPSDGWRPVPLEKAVEIPLPPVQTSSRAAEREIPTVQAEADATVPEAPAPRRRMDPLQDAPSVRWEPGERVLEASRGPETVFSGLEPSRRPEMVFSGLEPPPAAEIAVPSQPESSRSRWSQTEEPVLPAQASLAAEAVSRAFERDGRRYDSGFPLY